MVSHQSFHTSNTPLGAITASMHLPASAYKALQVLKYLHAQPTGCLQAQNAAPDLSQLPDPSELFGKAKGAADDVSGKAKGAADQASGSAKGAAEQAKGSASGAASKVSI